MMQSLLISRIVIHTFKKLAKNDETLLGFWALREQEILRQETSAHVLQGAECKPPCPEGLIPNVIIMEIRLRKDLENTLQENVGNDCASCTVS